MCGLMVMHPPHLAGSHLETLEKCALELAFIGEAAAFGYPRYAEIGLLAEHAEREIEPATANMPLDASIFREKAVEMRARDLECMPDTICVEIGLGQMVLDVGDNVVTQHVHPGTRGLGLERHDLKAAA